MKRNFLIAVAASAMALTTANRTVAQSELYPKHFDLEQVTLLAGPMKTAMDLNIKMLMQYDTDRLLTPFVRQSGLASTTDQTSPYYQWLTKHPNFKNWGGDAGFDLSGHVGGHYLSALALAYAACHDEAVRTQLKERMDYMLKVMKDCQDAYDKNTEGLYGFIGGQPINDSWKALYRGDLSKIQGNWGWVPFYCQHKILAGLRDAYLYGNSPVAKELFRKLADWSVNVVAKVSDSDFEGFLNCEHGGMNESMLDAYQLFGDQKYLAAAKKYTHKAMLNGMQALNKTFLDGKHANTQVPKYIGMERIYEEDATATAYKKAAENFWQDVAQNRTVCIGGNSVGEHFLSAANSNRYIDQLDGPESCNSNNMLKMSEMLFDRTGDAKYADFYEGTMWNHILSTQDPTTGGYVYFTTLRPQGYRIYSQPNQGMWCCVGTGMENHSKYGHFIYTHEGSEKLYVNLFTASRLDAAGFKLRQQTDFPFAATTTITMEQGGTFTLAIRHPAWACNGYAIAVNGTPVSGLSVQTGAASYAEVHRTWAAGDVVTVTLPMELRYATCPGLADYVAFHYGPVLLAARTSTADADEAANSHLTYEATLQNEYAHEGRMDHAPGSRATALSLTTAPLLIGERDGDHGVLSRISAADPATCTFTLDASRPGVEGYTWTTLTLQPFYQIHHARYACYWYQQTAENYAHSDMGAEETRRAAIAARTLDFVATGEQQSEAGHFPSSRNSTTGTYNNEYYRDARPADGYLQYTLAYEGEAIADGLSVLCRFTQADAGRRASLYVDGTCVAHITALAAFNGPVANGFYDVEYPIPATLMRDAQGQLKRSFTVRLAADQGTNAPGLYYLRLMRDYATTLPATVTTTAGATRRVIDGVTTGENGQDEMSHSLAFSGNNSGQNHGTYQGKYWRNGLGGETYSYELLTGGHTQGVSLVVEYWGGDAGRDASITIDGTEITTQAFHGSPAAFVTYEYAVPVALLAGKERVRVAFASRGGSYTPGTYHVYLTTDADATAIHGLPAQAAGGSQRRGGRCYDLAGRPLADNGAPHGIRISAGRKVAAK